MCSTRKPSPFLTTANWFCPLLLALITTLIAIPIASFAAAPPASNGVRPAEKAAVAARAPKGVITPTAMTSWKIVCDPAATESERYAATEFQRLFKEMTGAELPLVETATRRLRRGVHRAGRGAPFRPTDGPARVGRGGVAHSGRAECGVH